MGVDNDIGCLNEKRDQLVVGVENINPDTETDTDTDAKDQSDISTRPEKRFWNRIPIDLVYMVHLQVILTIDATVAPNAKLCGVISLIMTVFFLIVRSDITEVFAFLSTVNGMVVSFIGINNCIQLLSKVDKLTLQELIFIEKEFKFNFIVLMSFSVVHFFNLLIEDIFGKKRLKANWGRLWTRRGDDDDDDNIDELYESDELDELDV